MNKRVLHLTTHAEPDAVGWPVASIAKELGQAMDSVIEAIRTCGSDYYEHFRDARDAKPGFRKFGEQLNALRGCTPWPASLPVAWSRKEAAMPKDGGKSSRDAMQDFGEHVEDAAKSIGKAVDALRGEPKREAATPDDDNRDGEITININR